MENGTSLVFQSVMMEFVLSGVTGWQGALIIKCFSTVYGDGTVSSLDW